jgi:putative membrane protein insertion efficiency factor
VNPAQRLLIGLVKGYRLFLSPWLGSSCRFTPSCSVYSLQALQQHGAAAGAYLTVARIARCHPWCEGGHDPVPAAPPRLFSRFRANSHAGPGSHNRSGTHTRSGTDTRSG